MTSSPDPTPGAETCAALEAAAVVAVVRAAGAERAQAMAEAALEAGLSALEITACTPGAFALLRHLSARFPRVVLGVGTVRGTEALDRARDAGARFVVSPHTDPALVGGARTRGLIAIPGAFTPTEILAAHAAGADFVKLFPVSAGGGPAFVRQLRGPLPDVPLWVSGDVAIADVPAYRAAGAQLVGLTSALFGQLDELPEAELRRLVAARAAAALGAVRAPPPDRALLAVEGPSERLALSLADLEGAAAAARIPALDALVPGRPGRAVRLRGFLERAGIGAEDTVELESADGFVRTVPGRALLDGGLVQIATPEGPLARSAGGPVRLFVLDGSDRCDNVKGLARIRRALNPPSGS